MKKDIIKKIRGTEWWQLEAPGVFQLLFAPALGFSKMIKYYPSMRFWGVIFLVRKNYAYQFMNAKDSISFVRYLIQKNEKEKTYVKNKIKEWEKIRSKTYEIGKKIDSLNLRQTNNRKLFSLFKSYSELITNTWAIPLVFEGNGIYFELVLMPKVIKETGLPEPELMEKLSVLTTPEKLSFGEEEHISILEIALNFVDKKIPKNIKEKELKEKFPKPYKKLLRHQKKFYWIRNNYLDSYVIPTNDFLKKVKKTLKKKARKEIEKEMRTLLGFKKLKKKKGEVKEKLKVSKKLLEEIEIFSLLGWWHDRRKEMNLKTGHYITVLIKEISRRMNIDYRDGYYLLNDEIENFLLKNKKINLKKIKERKKIMALFAFGNGNFKIVKKRDALICWNEIFKKMKDIKSERSLEIKGFVASTGGQKKVTGGVTIVLNVRKDKFKKGNFLVTSMTRPEFVPLMKQAKAIITNEGGITSHAAIVSRELNIPCIIGTKVATKVLKDGDKVVIDVKKGIIKKL